MMDRTYGRRNRSLTRSYTESGFSDGAVSDSPSQESPQDVYNFTFSSQDSIRWSSDPYGFSNSMSQENNDLTIFPAGNAREEDNGGFEGFDGGFWKSMKKVKIGDSEPFALNSSQESDELTILPSKKSRETGKIRYADAVLGESKDSEPYCLNSSQESEDLSILPPKKSKENRKMDGVFQKSKRMEENGVVHKKKKKKAKSSGEGSSSIPVGPTSTLMETQEFGEMMEHVDEVNFALDGLKKGQLLRVRRSSLLSLLSLCGTAQQRRLLRAHGMAKTIVDAILGLNFDDSASNLAAAALFYILTNDSQDDCHLDSQSCIYFLMKLLKPHTSDGAKTTAGSLGSKLLAIRMDIEGPQDLTRGSDSSSAEIRLKVEEVLVSCKDLKRREGNDNRIERPELNPKWISLLVMEKSCLSTISIEDTSGRMRKSGGKFKEKLRELGGLNAVFEVARTCHSILEGRLQQSPSSILDSKDNTGLESLALLLKCMKIMENATFLSTENQNHLLGMKGNFDSQLAPRSFTKLILSVIKILSSICLLRSSLVGSPNEMNCLRSGEISHACKSKVDDNGILSIASSSRCCTTEEACSQESFGISRSNQWSTSGQPRCSKSNSETTSVTDPWLKMRIDSSTSGSCSGTSGNGKNGRTSSNIGFSISNNCKILDRNKVEPVEDSQDPFAFHEDDFEPSKWDLMFGGRKVCQAQNIMAKAVDHENQCQSLLVLDEEESDKVNLHSSEVSFPSAIDEEKSHLLADCLLSAVKVLMNLTNDNPTGCQQIAACGGLETLSSLIVSHFPSFNSYIPHSGSLRESSTSSRSIVEVDRQNDIHLTDQELDLLVAILGLLVNLVEKDGLNRSRLAAAHVSLPNSEGSEEKTRTDLIPLLCSIFLANQGAGEAAGEAKYLSLDDEEALLQGEKEAEKMIVEAYAALLLAFLSTESTSTRNAIAECLPDNNLASLVPVLERFVEFHLSLNMIPPETHRAVLEVIESCRIP